MIDLINKTNDEINSILNKYQSLYYDLPTKSVEFVNLVYTIHLAFTFLNKDNKLSLDLKTWSVLLIKRIFKTINTEDDVINEIDNFLKYYNAEYENYINNIAFFSNEFDRDYSFLTKYIRTKDM